MSEPRMPAPALTAGLLMEGAQSQQQLAAAALAELRAHTAGLDAVVRDEIHRTLLESLAALSTEVARVTRSLEGLGRRSRWRAALLFLLLSGAGLVPLVALRAWLPTPASVAALQAEEARLTASLARLRQQGGRVQLRECGLPARLCARIDTKAAHFGADGEFAVLAGY